jgi:hypothetical protein
MPEPITGVGASSQAPQTASGTGNMGEVVCIRLPIVPITRITLAITPPHNC